MDQLIGVINELHDAFGDLKMDVKMDLPQIAVVGSQSSGKSSVLENVVGKDFLPRGSGIVTRCPLVLKLIQTKGDDGHAGEWAEFLHKPGQRFTDFLLVRQEIENRTREIAGPTAITTTPISLTIYSPNVLTLTLVDLPGLVMTAIEGQPKDIDKQIKDMVLSFIRPPNTIILAVTPANADLATSAALRIAKQVDPEGTRTIGVLTKLDIMDRGTDAIDILEGRVYNLRRGFIGVVNRGQMDINEGKSLAEARQAERDYFESHPTYCRIAQRLGTQYLAKTLNTMLMQHIQAALPDLKAHIDKLYAHTRKQQERLGMLDETQMDPGAHLLQLIKNFSDGINSTIDGDALDVHKTELVGGARIDYIFHECFAPYVNSLRASTQLSDEFIRITIRNRTGMQSTLFPSDQVFITLSKQQIRRLEEPSVKCVSFVHDELAKIVESCAAKVERFPTLKERVVRICGELLNKYRTPTVTHVKTLIAAEETYINVKHPVMQELAARAFSHHVDNAAAAAAGAAVGAGAAQAIQQQPLTPQQQQAATARAGGGGGAPANTAAANAAQLQQQQQQQQLQLQQQMAANAAAAAFAAAGNRTLRMDEVPRQILLGASMSEFEVRQNNSIREMVEAYFSICQRTVSDQVPKIVTLLMIHRLREEIYPTLVKELYGDASKYEQLLTESSDIAAQRKATKNMMACIMKAQEALNRVRDFHGK